MEQIFPNRKSIRLKEYDYSREGWYYVTICAKNKNCLFGEIVNEEMKLNEKGRIIENCWERIPDHFGFVEVDYFVVMPNHLHGIIIINEQSSHRRGEVTSPLRWKHRITLGKIIAYYKYQTTKIINQRDEKIGEKIWQRNYYEHIIRNENDLFHIRQYIENNILKCSLDKHYPEN
ncbi:MAG: hypothetical protein NTX22_03250 [Ignavibacteriales bacterium]|nr:hypothetical protein [Ignavibacteriales bacterium]